MTIFKALAPRTVSDLIRALQRMRVKSFQIIEPYDSDKEKELLEVLRTMGRQGDITVLVIRSE